MSLIRIWGANQERPLFDSMDDLFNFLDPMAEVDRKFSIGPKTESRKTEHGSTISITIPGAHREGIKVEVSENNVLIVSYDSEPDSTLRPQPFVKSWNLGKDVNLGKISAVYKDGILNIDIPKAKEKKRKTISVKVD